MTGPAILVGNRTGGQGKTIVSQLIHHGYSCAQQSLGAASADSSAQGEASKLGRILPEVEELGTGANLADLKENQHAAVQHWDRLGRRLLNGNCVIDLGANVLPLVFQWARERKAKSLLVNKDIRLVIPVTAQAQSVSDGLAMLEASLDPAGYLPVRHRYVVLNEYHGGFHGFAGDVEFEALAGSKRDSSVRVIRLSKAVVEVWGQIEAGFMSLGKLANMASDQYASAFGLDNEFAAVGAEADLKEWVSTSIRAFVTAGLVPAPVEALPEEPNEAATEGAAGVSGIKKNNPSKAA